MKIVQAILYLNIQRQSVRWKDQENQRPRDM